MPNPYAIGVVFDGELIDADYVLSIQGDGSSDSMTCGVPETTSPVCDLVCDINLENGLATGNGCSVGDVDGKVSAEFSVERVSDGKATVTLTREGIEVLSEVASFAFLPTRPFACDEDWEARVTVSVP